MNNRKGVIRITEEALKNFDVMLLVFKNCLVRFVSDSLYYSQIAEYRVETKFLPEIPAGGKVPEYSVEISRDDENEVSQVTFISIDGERRYVAYLKSGLIECSGCERQEYLSNKKKDANE